MLKISAVILTYNNQASIQKAISSVLWCDEVVIIDDFSSDQTLANASQNNVQIFQRKLSQNFSEQRNFALKKTKYDWVFFLDADEVVSDSLRDEIQSLSDVEQISGFYIPRIDYIWGRKMRFGEFSDFSIVRLAKKNAGEWEGSVHETWKIKGKTGHLQNPILHYSSKSSSEFLRKINFYSSLRAAELYKKGNKADSLIIFLYAFGKFFQNYILKLGILDGVAGLIHSIFMSFYSFLVRAKLWVLWYGKNNTKNHVN